MTDAARVCVFGVGAIGTHLALAAADGGAALSVVARGDHLAAIRRDGLQITRAGKHHVLHPAASDNPADLGAQDIVILAVKAPALAGAARMIAPLLRPDTAVVCALNGVPWWYFHGHGGGFADAPLPDVDPDAEIWNRIGPERAIGCVVSTAARVTAPGQVIIDNPGQPLFLGEPSGQMTMRLERVRALLAAGGLNAIATDTIRHTIWDKLQRNIASGPVAILTQTSLKHLYASPAMLTLRAGIQAEVAAIAAAYGFDLPVETDAQRQFVLQSDHKVSILQDFERGQVMELDAMFRAPLHLARMAGVATPLLDIVVELALIRAQYASPQAARE